MLIYTCWVKHCETWVSLVIPLRWGEEERNYLYLIALTEVYLRFIKFFHIFNFSLFHKTFQQEKGYKGLKRYFWWKYYFYNWNIVMYVLAQTADHTFLWFSTIFWPQCGALLQLADPCPCCACEHRSPGNSVTRDGVLCSFPVQTQLACSGSKLQLNSGKLTDLIRSLELHHSHFRLYSSSRFMNMQKTIFLPSLCLLGCV